jgi:4-amino-4-deoxy-L-arabinose transferase-like glycosyltransferase
VVALSIEQVVTEHAILTEALFTPLLMGGLVATVVALTGRAHGYPWWALAGVAVAAATVVRPAGLFVLPVIGLGALVASGSVRARFTRCAAYALPALALLLTNSALQQAEPSGAFGLSTGGGWWTYGRVAPFADCREMDVPRGTEALCEQADARTRPGPDWYVWNHRSPAHRMMGEGPAHRSEELGRWAGEAMAATPRAYLSHVGRDLLRYISGRFTPAVFGNIEGLPIDLDVDRHLAYNQQWIEEMYGAPADLRRRGAVDVLAVIQPYTRLRGAWFVLALVLTAVAAMRLRGRERLAVVTLAACAAALLVMPVATVTFNLRYATPVAPLAAVTAVLGLWQLADWAAARAGGRRGGRVPAPRPGGR